MHHPIQCCLAKSGHSKTPFTPAVCSPQCSGPVSRAASCPPTGSLSPPGLLHPGLLTHRCADRCTAHNAPHPQLGLRAPGAIRERGPWAAPGHYLRHVATAGGSPAPAAPLPGQSGQKSELPPAMWGLEEGVVGGLFPRPLTWSREECTETTANRSTPLWKPGLYQPEASARAPPLTPPPPCSFPTNHRLGGTHRPRGRDLTIRRVSTSRQPPPVAPAARLRSGRALWRACALWKKMSWTPPRTAALLLRCACEGRRGRCRSSCPW